MRGCLVPRVVLPFELGHGRTVGAEECVVVFRPSASYCCSGVLRLVRNCGPHLGQNIQGGLPPTCVGGQGTTALRRRGADQVFTGLGAEVEAAGG